MMPGGGRWLLLAGNMASGHFALALVCLKASAEWRKGWCSIWHEKETQ